jgi:hypothetical protein
LGEMRLSLPILSDVHKKTRIYISADFFTLIVSRYR